MSERDFEWAKERIGAIMQGFVADCGNEIVNALFAKTNQGKMLRSKLLLAVSGVSEEALGLCAIIELIQSASLLHDDVIDNADIRRGIQTLNRIFNSKLAVVSGDYLLSCAVDFVREIGDNRILNIFIQSLAEMCKGEVAQYFCANKIPAMDEYLLKTEQKTAQLFVAALECSAILSPEIDKE